ncbi:MAG: hypothetical protein RIK85_15515 [Marinobacter sp.]
MSWLSKGAGILALAVTLGGCSSPSSDEPSSEGSSNVAGDQLATVSGRAAVGAPITNAPVDARCEGGEGFVGTVTTNESGGFLGQLATSALPCALRVTGNGEDKVLHSYVDSGGNINITPFTDLIIALSAAKAPMDWFDQDEHSTDLESLDIAKEEFLEALRNANYNLPANEFDPFRSSFQINDAVDQLLDTFSAAVRNMPNFSGYQAFVDLISSGNLQAIPPAPTSSEDDDSENSDNTGGSDDGSDGGDDSGDNDGGGSDELTAADLCAPPQIAPTGTLIEFSQQFYDTQSGDEIGALSIRQESLGPMEFRGEETHAILVEDVSEGGNDEFWRTTYLSIDTTELVERTHGSTSVDPDTGEETTLWFEPTFNYPYALAIDEEYVQSVSLFASNDGGPGALLVELDHTIQFKGVETVTVPAGTFDACKYLQTSSTSSHPTPSTSAVWFNVEDGIAVKSALVEDGVEKTEVELLSYSVNGAQQAP